MLSQRQRLLFCLCLLTPPTAPLLLAQSIDSATGITQQASYSSQSTEGRGIQAWIERNSPSFGPVRLRGKVTLVNSYSVRGPFSAATELGPNGPQVTLPQRGVPGQRISITDTLPDGSSQAWDYRWEGDSRGGSWQLTGYRFDDGSRGREETLSPYPRVR